MSWVLPHSGKNTRAPSPSDRAGQCLTSSGLTAPSWKPMSSFAHLRCQKSASIVHYLQGIRPRLVPEMPAVSRPGAARAADEPAGRFVGRAAITRRSPCAPSPGSTSPLHLADDVHLAGLAVEPEDQFFVAVDQTHRIGLEVLDLFRAQIEAVAQAVAGDHQRDQALLVAGLVGVLDQAAPWRS